nr:hypothetical protein [Clostridia bacterium]
YDKIIFTERSKLKYCVGNYIEVIVEDSPIEIKELSTKIPVICFHNYWNQNISGKNIVRAYSWYDVYDKIQKLK